MPEVLGELVATDQLKPCAVADRRGAGVGPDDQAAVAEFLAAIRSPSISLVAVRSLVSRLPTVHDAMASR